MTTAATAAFAPTETVVKPSRIVAIDIFRGLTMAVMIFVNQLAGVRGLPWWTYHAHGQQNLMTYVDMVFPFFLFIVGMSLPLSVEHRLKQNPSQVRLWWHVITRTVSLLALGLILANAEYADAGRMHISGSAWALIGLVCSALYLNVYPKSARGIRYGRVLRILGLVGVVVVFAMFRRVTGPTGQAAWINTSYPEILGLIGMAYFAAAILYIPTRRWRWAPLFWFVLVAGYSVVLAMHMISLPAWFSLYIWPFDNGAHVWLVLAGVLTSQLFLGALFTDCRPPIKQALARALLLSAGCLTAGWFLIPLGISKNRATPTWAMWCAGAAVLTFTALYWICDCKRKTAWAALVRPAGSNTLSTYLLPDLWDLLLGISGVRFFDTHLNFGLPGAGFAAVFTVAILLLASLLTRAGVRLQL